ncbi:hypothetical protein GSI_03251 [Ganoderma sinense ZZ0214-1]|uniref:Uncharacterized protein n=1 Tax=Ganoderma sinense ZZ0214-1 TaxID=1077348 RepID=A0A2G8SL34_9APHY|nr:hypothetical protein GSI_03251 [Ganoderma sinense ZZ0214-1]
MSSLFQNAYYLAINFNAILYGAELAIYWMTMKTLFEKRKACQCSGTDKFYAAFSTALLVLITIYMSTEAVFGQEMWIVHSGDPGGPLKFFVNNANVWYQTMGTTASVILIMLSDALLIYRMHVVWPDFRIVAFPCFLYTASIECLRHHPSTFTAVAALGIIELYLSGKPNANFFVGTAAQLGLAYYATTISLNVIATGVICARLVYFSRAATSDFATPRNPIATGSVVARYTGTLPVVVESALPYSLAGVAFLVSYGMQSDVSILFGALYGMFTCVSPQLIILRIVTGEAWTREKTAETVSALECEGFPAANAALASQADGGSVDHKSVQEV